jgi:predicted nucleotidyltransferase/predicted transcriptional regulator
MPLSRVTLTLPPDLVAAADRLAKRRGTSRSALVAEALREHVADSSRPETHAGRVAESRAATGFATDATNDALLEELRRRLAAAADAAGLPAPHPSTPRLRFDRDRLAALCRRHHIAKLSLFGSVLSDAFGPASDVDVLVEFEPGHTPGLAITDIEDELSAVFGGHRVDLVTARSLHRMIRERVLATAMVQYAA